MRKGPVLLIILFGLISSAQASGPRVLGVVNGIEKTFPQVVVWTDLSDQEPGTCTATLVGPKAFLTAAHCGNEGDTVVVQAGSNIYEGKLHISPHYHPRKENLTDPNLALDDIAVIETSQPVRDILPWSLTQKSSAVGEKVFFAGFGCSSLEEIDPRFPSRIGMGEVSRRSTCTLMSLSGPGYYGTLCPGDSGGPAFSLSPENGIKIVGISHSIAASLVPGAFDPLASFFADVTAPGHTAYLQSVARERGIEISGINGATSHLIPSVGNSTANTCYEKGAALGWSLIATRFVCGNNAQQPDEGRTACMTKQVGTLKSWPHWKDVAERCIRLSVAARNSRPTL